MDLYFFRSPQKTYKIPFRRFAIRQNFRITRITSLVVAVVCLCIFASRFFINYQAILPHAREYGSVLMFLFASSAIIYIAATIIDRVRMKRKLRIKYSINLAYALVFISGFMWLTFIAQHNPKNTMTMFLIGTFSVAFLWLMELRETVITLLFSVLVFSAGIAAYQVEPQQLVGNYMVAVFIWVAYFIVSRIGFSYHFNYFIQLSTIEQNNKEINHINRRKSEIMSIVVHDLKSPINNITALTDLVRNYAKTNEERNEYYDMIQSACDEANHIIQDLILAAKNDEDIDLQMDDVDMKEYLQNISKQWQHRIPSDKRLHLQHIEDNVMARIDKQKMQRVLDNLIGNAIKFTKTDGEIKLLLQSGQNKIRLSVTDNGVGIPPNLQPYLFERFSKAGRNGLNGEKSHGLGLSICRQIVEQHGGAIRVDSKEGEGTTFHIDLPFYVQN